MKATKLDDIGKYLETVRECDPSDSSDDELEQKKKSKRSKKKPKRNNNESDDSNKEERKIDPDRYLTSPKEKREAFKPLGFLGNVICR